MNWIKSKYIVVDIYKKHFYLSDYMRKDDTIIENAEHCIKEGALHVKGNEVEQVRTPTVSWDEWTYQYPDVEKWHKCSIKTTQVKGPWNWFRNRGTVTEHVFRNWKSVPKEYSTSPFYEIYSEFKITDLREQKDNGLED